jgi:hypothetical protein
MQVGEDESLSPVLPGLGGPGHRLPPAWPGPFCPVLRRAGCDLGHTSTAKFPDRCAPCGARETGLRPSTQHRVTVMNPSR